MRQSDSASHSIRFGMAPSGVSRNPQDYRQHRIAPVERYLHTLQGYWIALSFFWAIPLTLTPLISCVLPWVRKAKTISTLMSNIAFFGSACTIRMGRSTRSLSVLMRRMRSYAAGSMPIRLTQLTSSLGRRILSDSQRKIALAIASWRSPKQLQRAVRWRMRGMVRSSV